MSSILRFALLATTLVIVLAVVAVPIATSLVAGSVAHDIGLDADNLHISVDLLGPQLLSGAVRSVRVTGDGVSVPNGTVGHVDVTLDDVSLADHSFASLTGMLTGVRIDAPSGPFTVDSVNVSGPSRRIHATGTISAANARKLVKGIAQDAGVNVDSVQLRNGGVTIQSSGQQIDAALHVAGSALVLDRPGAGSTVLIGPAPSEQWQITSVDVSPSGISVGLDVDAEGLATDLQNVLGGR